MSQGLDMFPRFSSQNRSNISPGYAEFDSQLSGCYLFRNPFLSYFKNLFFSENSSTRFFSKWMSFFGNHVRIIFCICANKKVIRSHTQTVIAFMKNVKTATNMSMFNDIRNPMRVMNDTAEAESSIPAFSFRPFPIPTSLRFFNAVPKALFKTSHIIFNDFLHAVSYFGGFASVHI